MNDILNILDMAAYNDPETIPQSIRRNDKKLLKLYFRHSVVLYKLHALGVDKDTLQKLKNAFIEDFQYCEMLFNSALKTCREQNRLNPALMNCRHNSDNCEYCKAVSAIIGAPTAENEPDIEVT